MSRAGVYSSIGDEYQDLVAAYWVTRMLSEPDILKIEIDVTSLSTSGVPFSVDDVVIFYSGEDCDSALSAAEILLEKVFDADLDIRINDKFAALLTFLFREAEEREEADCGKMLQRVIALQDSLLKKGVSHIEAWLQEAERP